MVRVELAALALVIMLLIAVVVPVMLVLVVVGVHLVLLVPECEMHSTHQGCSGFGYRVTHHVDSNHPLTSKQKFHFGLACPDQARPKRNFCYDFNRRFESM